MKTILALTFLAALPMMAQSHHLHGSPLPPQYGRPAKIIMPQHCQSASRHGKPDMHPQGKADKHHNIPAAPRKGGATGVPMKRPA